VKVWLSQSRGGQADLWTATPENKDCSQVTPDSEQEPAADLILAPGGAGPSSWLMAGFGAPGRAIA
jgi:hypothetical protein